MMKWDSNDLDLFEAARFAVARHQETGERVGVYVYRHGGVYVCNERDRYNKDEGVPTDATCYGVAWNGAFYFTPVVK